MSIPLTESPGEQTVSDPRIAGQVERRSASAVPVAPRPINRYEIKYLVPHTVRERLIDALRGYTRDDPYDQDGRGYPVYSVYWDSPDLKMFWEKIEGVSFRQKLRFRRYGSAPYIFVEIKQRFDRTLQKLRLQYPLAESSRFFEAERLDEWDTAFSAHPVVTEILRLRHRYNLRPTMAISYRRHALFGEFEPDLRITFDSRLQYSDAHPDIIEPFETGKYLLDPRLSVLEVKFSERVPLWLIKTIQRLELQSTRMSKYCTAIDKAYYDGQLAPIF